MSRSPGIRSHKITLELYLWCFKVCFMANYIFDVLKYALQPCKKSLNAWTECNCWNEFFLRGKERHFEMYELHTSHQTVSENSEGFPASWATSKQKTADRPLSKRAVASLLVSVTRCLAAVLTFAESGRKIHFRGKSKHHCSFSDFPGKKREDQYHHPSCLSIWGGSCFAIWKTNNIKSPHKQKNTEVPTEILCLEL